MEINPQNITPMIRQYLDIKKDHQDSILFFRMGDFYEMFFEDALKVSPILEIALTSRNKGEENAIPFCGVPHHSASSYIARLIQAGLKVAICEQVEDPTTAKGIVRREVIRVITPGLVLETESLDAKGNNYLASLSFHQNQQGLAFADISTGEMGVALFYDPEDLISELIRREPREILVSPADHDHPLVQKIRRQFPKSLIHCDEIADEGKNILSFFSPRFQESWGETALEKLSPLVERASLRLLAYIRTTLKTEANHLSEIRWSPKGSHLILDTATIRNLELVRNLQDGGVWGTLLHVLDRTQTSMGARRLKNWILYPLAEEVEIIKRQQAIGELIDQSPIFSKIRDELGGIVDLERQNSRIATGIANARDLIALGHSLHRLPRLKQELLKLKSPFFQNLLSRWTDLSETAEEIVKTIRDEAPLTLREGGLIRDGVISELDELRSILKDGKNHLARMEEDEKRKTGISSLKVRYNKVFGYYIEIPNGKRDSVPPHYLRKQTLVNAERYITPELKGYEDKVLGAEEKIRHLEYDAFLQLRSKIAEEAGEIGRMARKISELDALGSLGTVAQENNYSCPVFTGGRDLLIEEGRHPVLEKLFPSHRFVPNDVSLNDSDCCLILLTGPNMAGKSTILRQTALIALMAHMGSFVPAKTVQLGMIDRIFTRIGASDNLSKNQSTFWVEMEETAAILKSATERSLIILDEIGRGTSTYDGLSVAWAVAEHLHDQIRAKSLFAAHYHELMALSESRSGIKNFNIAVKEWEGEILFLYRMVPGGTSQSYGVQVAALAGIPGPVIQRAGEILKELQDKHPEAPLTNPTPFAHNSQMTLFQGAESPVVLELKNLKVDELTPKQALELLYDLQKKIIES